MLVDPIQGCLNFACFMDPNGTVLPEIESDPGQLLNLRESDARVEV